MLQTCFQHELTGKMLDYDLEQFKKGSNDGNKGNEEGEEGKEERESKVSEGYGLKIPLELMTDQELEDGRADIRHCAEEAAFFDNAKKSYLLYESERQIKGEIARRKGIQHEK